MAYKVDEIEGIGPAYAEKLAAAGIKDTEDLLEKAGSAYGRKKLEEQTGVSGKLILEWVNRADLMRVPGIGSEYSDLLEAAGVDTVKELRTRRADNLTVKMADVNEAKKLTRRVPTLSMVEKWIEAAKALEARVTY